MGYESVDGRWWDSFDEHLPQLPKEGSAGGAKGEAQAEEPEDAELEIGHLAWAYLQLFDSDSSARPAQNSLAGAEASLGFSQQ